MVERIKEGSSFISEIDNKIYECKLRVEFFDEFKTLPSFHVLYMDIKCKEKKESKILGIRIPYYRNVYSHTYRIGSWNFKNHNVLKFESVEDEKGDFTRYWNPDDARKWIIDGERDYYVQEENKERNKKISESYKHTSKI